MRKLNGTWVSNEDALDIYRANLVQSGLIANECMPDADDVDGNEDVIKTCMVVANISAKVVEALERIEIAKELNITGNQITITWKDRLDTVDDYAEETIEPDLKQ